MKVRENNITRDISNFERGESIDSWKVIRKVSFINFRKIGVEQSPRYNGIDVSFGVPVTR